jgi:hypothetical protein
MAAKDTDATIYELLQSMFSVRLVPRLYKENQLLLEKILETAVRIEGVSCETVVSL